MRTFLETMRAVLKQEGCSAPVPAPAENQESRPNIPESVVVEPAHPNARPIYWQSGKVIVGPAVPEYLGKLGERFFVFVEYQGHSIPIDSDRLRSRHAFLQQVQPNAVDVRPQPALNGGVSERGLR